MCIYVVAASNKAKHHCWNLISIRKQSAHLITTAKAANKHAVRCGDMEIAQYFVQMRRGMVFSFNIKPLLKINGSLKCERVYILHCTWWISEHLFKFNFLNRIKQVQGIIFFFIVNSISMSINFKSRTVHILELLL